MGIHQPAKAHPQRIFHLYTSFQFLESFAYHVPLSASLRTGFKKNENIIIQLIYQY